MEQCVFKWNSKIKEKKETPLVQFSIVASGKDTEDMRFQ